MADVNNRDVLQAIVLINRTCWDNSWNFKTIHRIKFLLVTDQLVAILISSLPFYIFSLTFEVKEDEFKSRNMPMNQEAGNQTVNRGVSARHSARRRFRM